MKHEAQPMPSPMTEARLRVMQKRVAREQPLAVAADQPLVVDSVRERVMERALGKKKFQATRDAKYDDDGDEIEVETDWTLIDRYLATPLGSPAAGAALAMWRRAWGR